MQYRLMARAALALATLVAVAGSCDSPTKPPVGIAIELAQSAIDVVPGQFGPGPERDPYARVAFSLVRTGYDVDVPLTAIAPAPLTVVVKDRIGPHDPLGPWFVHIEVPRGTPAGEYPVTLRATAISRGSVDATITVRVRPFAMRLHESTVRVNQGATNELTVYFTADPNLTDLTVAATIAPGLSVTQAPGSLARSLAITAAPDAALGSRTITVTASSGGLTESRDVQVVVQSPPPKREIAFRFCHNRILNFLAFGSSYAYRNDGEAWKSVAPDENDIIRFEATEKLSFQESYTYNPGAGYEFNRITRVLHATATELSEMQCASARRGDRRFSVSVTNADAWDLTYGVFKGGFVGGVPPGPHDLVAVANRTVPTGVLRVGIIRRDQDLPDGSTISLDFASAEAVILDSAAYAPVGAAAVSVSTHLHTPTSVARLDRALVAPRYWAFPEASLAPADVQSVLFTSGGRGVVQYFRSVQPLSPAFGPEIAQAAADVEAQTITLPSQPEYPDMAGVAYRKVYDYRGTYDLVEVWQTRSFLGGTPTAWTFSPPDLGRNAFIPPITDDYAGVGALAVGGKTSVFFGSTPPPGTEMRWARQWGGRFAEWLPFPMGR